MKDLVIVESPLKAKKIQKILGTSYYVLSSFGHLRNLKPKNMGIKIDENFKPMFEINNKKKAQYNKLKKVAAECSNIILATDKDREGEAIAWHLAVKLKVSLKENNRITFTEITKSAILKAMKERKRVDMNLVNAQLARQTEDYIVGYELSPLTKKFVNAPSAGRVQSSVNKMICEKEIKIEKFVSKDYYYTIGNFNDLSGKNDIKGKLNKKIENRENIINFLGDCKESKFTVKDLKKKDCNKRPHPPFTTSTAQIEIGKRFKVSIKAIMGILQNLYQAGVITYHRTDSTTLSKEIMEDIKNFILGKYKKKYLKLRNYKTKTKCAQEAHEAIRPTLITRENLDEEFGDIDKKIYKLIWERTIASQMADMRYERYTLNVAISKRKELFIANADKTVFDGYTRLYNDNFKDEDDIEEDEEPVNKYFEGIKVGEELKYKKIIANGKVTKPPPRYSEATLVKDMKKLGIGRPSTYADMVSKVQERKYVEKKTFSGKVVKLENIILENGIINKKEVTNKIGTEKNKLTSTKLGRSKNVFLEENFGDIIDYKYTANLESELDQIANGNKNKLEVLNNFYNTFHPKVLKMQKKKCDTVFEQKTKRLVGEDKKTGKNIYAYKAQYGPCLQVGEDSDKNKRYFGLDKFEKKYTINGINEIEANSITQFPKNLGEYEGSDIIVQKGKHGYYIRHNNINYSIKSQYDQFLSKENAAECLKKNMNKKLLKSFAKGKINVRDVGKGPFIQTGSKFVPMPKGIDIKSLTEDKCKEFIKNYDNYKKSNNKYKKYKKK